MNTDEYNNAVEYIKNIKREDATPSSPLWKEYRAAIDTKVNYEVELKKKKESK